MVPYRAGAVRLGPGHPLCAVLPPRASVTEHAAYAPAAAAAAVPHTPCTAAPAPPAAAPAPAAAPLLPGWISAAVGEYCVSCISTGLRAPIKLLVGVLEGGLSECGLQSVRCLQRLLLTFPSAGVCKRPRCSPSTLVEPAVRCTLALPPHR